MMSDMHQPAQLAQDAIRAALECKWDTALHLNNQILTHNPEDLCALNRSARAYMELGDIDLALDMYRKVLELDRYNVVAVKNIKRLTQVKQVRQGKSYTQVRNTSDMILNFIEEPGKTKIVQLVKPATPEVLFSLRVGDRVDMLVKGKGIQIQSLHSLYVGRLPDDLAYNLMQLMSYGNTYDSYLKHVMHNKVFIFIRETYRNVEVMSHPSFPMTGLGYHVPSVSVVSV